MSENQEEVLDNQEETQEQAAPETGVVEENEPTPVTQDEEGTIKINLAELNKPQEDAVQEQSARNSYNICCS